MERDIKDQMIDKSDINNVLQCDPQNQADATLIVTKQKISENENKILSCSQRQPKMQVDTTSYDLMQDSPENLMSKNKDKPSQISIQSKQTILNKRVRKQVAKHERDSENDSGSDDDADLDEEGENATLTEQDQTGAKRKATSTGFQKSQTKILQKWFLDNIQHPYLRKDDKAMLAEQTGLSKKQITGWFTNNRKRKYQKIAIIARKKNKDLSYVRDMIKLKFDKDLDQSLSSDAEDKLSCKKETHSQQPKIDLNEFIGKRMNSNGEFECFNMGQTDLKRQNNNRFQSGKQSTEEEQADNSKQNMYIQKLARAYNLSSGNISHEGIGQTELKALDLIQQNEKIQAQNILENVQKIIDQINKNTTNQTPEKSQEPPQSSRKIKYVPILYVKCPNGNTDYELLFDLKSQIAQYLKYHNCNQPNKKQNEQSDERSNKSGDSDHVVRHQQIKNIENYLSTFINLYQNNANQSGGSGASGQTRNGSGQSREPSGQNVPTKGSNVQTSHLSSKQCNKTMPGTTDQQKMSSQSRSNSPFSHQQLVLLQELTQNQSLPQSQLKKMQTLLDKFTSIQMVNNFNNLQSHLKNQQLQQNDPKYSTLPKPQEGSLFNQLQQQNFNNNDGMRTNTEDQQQTVKSAKIGGPSTQPMNTKSPPVMNHHLKNSQSSSLNEKKGIESFFKLQNHHQNINQSPGKAAATNMLLQQIVPLLQQQKVAQADAQAPGDSRGVIGKKQPPNQLGPNKSQNNTQQNNTTSMIIMNQGSLNSGIGLAGSVNIGQPSSYSNHCNNSNNSNNNFNGSNNGGSHGMNGFKNDSNNCCSAHTVHKQRNSKDSNDSESSKKSKNGQKVIRQKEEGVTPVEQKTATDEQQQQTTVNGSADNDDFTMQAFIGALRKLQQVKEYPQIHNIIDNIIKNINSGNMGGTGNKDITQTAGQNAATQNTNNQSGQTQSNFPDLPMQVENNGKTTTQKQDDAVVNEGGQTQGLTDNQPQQINQQPSVNRGNFFDCADQQPQQYQNNHFQLGQGLLNPSIAQFQHLMSQFQQNEHHVQASQIQQQQQAPQHIGGYGNSFGPSYQQFNQPLQQQNHISDEKNLHLQQYMDFNLYNNQQINLQNLVNTHHQQQPNFMQSTSNFQGNASDYFLPEMVNNKQKQVYNKQNASSNLNTPVEYNRKNSSPHEIAQPYNIGSNQQYSNQNNFFNSNQNQ